jgi:hypothetical protein
MNDDFSSIIASKAAALREQFPVEVKNLNKELLAHKDVCCLWHKRNEPRHKGRFGLMNECLDCMEDIQQGRCAVDVKNFDFSNHWPVKKFWDKVDIKGSGECWPWVGATKKNNTETAAYMPSPFHSGKIQSAARVAFWTSRGYTGRMRVFHQPGCDILCCNPLHLRLREVESIPQPDEISAVNLNFGNIFDHARANQLKS